MEWVRRSFIFVVTITIPIIPSGENKEVIFSLIYIFVWVSVEGVDYFRSRHKRRQILEWINSHDNFRSMVQGGVKDPEYLRSYLNSRFMDGGINDFMSWMKSMTEEERRKKLTKYD